MKTAFSLPDPLFKRGEKVRKRLRISRSEAYRRALADWIRRHGEDPITRKLNEVYGPGGEDSTLDPVLAAHVRRSLKKVEW